MDKHAWAVRPYPHGIYRMEEFLSQKMAAIGWPKLGDLKGCDREQIAERIKTHYGGSLRHVGQVTGIIDRFVNQIQIGDAIVIPDGNNVYFGIVTGGYVYKPELATLDEGYPHWIGVEYLFDGKAILRSQLPAIVFDALKGRQSVFGLPPEVIWEVIDNPDRFTPVLADTEDQKTKEEYTKKLSDGEVVGINSPRFEEIVRKVLSIYFPGLQRLSTRNAPKGADTDLKTSLPGNIVIRVQVKCYQNKHGELTEDVVHQLRDSMEDGEHGIIVTTNKVSNEARKLAESDSSKPIGIIDGAEFAQLVFDNIDKLDDEDLWALGLRRRLTLR